MQYSLLIALMDSELYHISAISIDENLAMSANILGYEPADLTVHPPRTAEGGFIFFV